MALRLWIVLLAGLSFLGGGAAGRWMTLRDVQATDERGPFEDYAQLLQRRYDLGEERMGYLRVVLETYERDLLRLEQRLLTEYRSAAEPELRALNREYEGYIRDRVLPPGRRSEYDASIAGLAIPSRDIDPFTQESR